MPPAKVPHGLRASRTGERAPARAWQELMQRREHRLASVVHEDVHKPCVRAHDVHEAESARKSQDATPSVGVQATEAAAPGSRAMKRGHGCEIEHSAQEAHK